MTRKMHAPALSDRLPLRGWDEGEWVQFQRPDRLVDEQIAAVQAQAEVVYLPDGSRLLRNRPSIASQETEMVTNCLIGCSVLKAENNEPLFVGGQNCREPYKPLVGEQRVRFLETWYSLDPDLAEAIIAELREWHPPFNIWGAPPPLSSPEFETPLKDSSDDTSPSTKSGDSSMTNGSESTD